MAAGMSALPLTLVLGIDTPIGLSVVRELGMRGVPVHGVGKTAAAIGAASRYCTTASVRPTGQSLEAWLPGLIAQSGAEALLAISEDDLIALAAMPPVIDGCQLLTPRDIPLGIVLDKTETLRRAKAIGIAIPETWLPNATDDFAARAAQMTYPLVAKWPDPPHIIAALTAAGLPLNKAEFLPNAPALLAMLDRYAALGIWPLIQQYCPGHGLGQMLHMHNGAATLRFQHRRLHEWPPEGGVSTVCRIESQRLHADQMKLSEALLVAINWQGAAMVEYRYDPQTGRYWLMEINGRFWGSLPLATHAGAHFAWETYRRAVLGDETPPLPARDALQARYMIPETRRLARLLFARKAIADPFFIAHPWRDLAHYIVSFSNPRVRYYVWSLSDPGPFLADMKAVIAKVLRRGTPDPK